MCNMFTFVNHNFIKTDHYKCKQMIDKIRKIMENADLTPAQFANEIGINRSSLTHLFSGRNQPSLDLAKKILIAFPEYKTEWLIMGVGPMRKNETEQMRSMPKNNQIEQDLFSQDIEESPNSTIQTEKAFADTPPQEIIAEKEIKRDNARELKIEGVPSKKDQIFKSGNDRKIKKIIFFYDDNSFEIYMNE